MKTPEEIKRGLAVHGSVMRVCGEQECPYFAENMLYCSARLCKDAFEYIDQLEETIEKMRKG